MITTALVDFAYYGIASVINALPASAGLPAWIMTGAAGLGGYLSMANIIAPVPVMLAGLTIVFGTDIAIWTYKGVKSIISHIPFIGGRGH